MTDKTEKKFRTRRTPAEMAATREAIGKETLDKHKVVEAAAMPPMVSMALDLAAQPKQLDEMSQDVIQEMRIRARDRALAEQAGAQEQAAKVAAQRPPQKWLYNSNIENISEFHESYLIVDDGYFEYTPPANFPFSDNDKETHLEFCRARVNTKPIDGVTNAKRIRTASERLISQTAYMPPQPTQARDDALMVVTEV